MAASFEAQSYDETNATEGQDFDNPPDLMEGDITTDLSPSWKLLVAHLYYVVWDGANNVSQAILLDIPVDFNYWRMVREKALQLAQTALNSLRPDDEMRDLVQSVALIWQYKPDQAKEILANYLQSKHPPEARVRALIITWNLYDQFDEDEIQREFEALTDVTLRFLVGMYASIKSFRDSQWLKAKEWIEKICPIIPPDTIYIVYFNRMLQECYIQSGSREVIALPPKWSRAEAEMRHEPAALILLLR